MFGNIDIMLSLVRHILTMAGGLFVSKGYLTTDMLEIVIGALMSIGGVVWGAAQKIEKPKSIPTPVMVGTQTPAPSRVQPSGMTAPSAAFDPAKQP